MGLFSALQRRLDRGLRKVAPALALEPTVDPDRIEGYVRQWCPDAKRRDEQTIDLAYGSWLFGPFGRDDPDWPDPDLSAHLQTAYTTRYRPHGNNEDDDWITDACQHLLHGLGRRLGGWFRARADEPWEDLADEPTYPMVLAPGRLSINEAAALLAPLYPDVEAIRVGKRAYGFVGGEVELHVQWTYPTIFPLARRAAWYRRPGKTTEYQILYEEPPDSTRTAELLRKLAEATRGVVLDQQGFPWPTPGEVAQAS